MSQQILDKIALEQVSKALNFAVGDTVQVHYKITEGSKERIQIYEGIVISIQNSGPGRSFTVRRVSYDVGVERIFPLNSPSVDKVEKIRSGKVRRASLTFLRTKIGKQGRLKEIKRKVPEDKIFVKAEQVREEIKARKEEAEKSQAAGQKTETSNQTEAEESSTGENIPGTPDAEKS